MKIAIHYSSEIFEHSSLWTHQWIKQSSDSQHEFEILNLFEVENLSELSRFDAIFWYLTNYSPQEMEFARSILAAAAAIGIQIFPNYSTAWHFDDKVAQMYLLEATGAPIPQSWLFATEGSAKKWFNERQNFPVVAKLRQGSGASNVRLLESKQDAIKYTKRMFSKGFSPSPSLAFKAISNARSADSWQVALGRIKRAPEFLMTRRKSKGLAREKGYVYLQEFVPNAGFDLKIVVASDKASFIVRHNRPNDFRASGGGDLSYDRSLVTPQIIESAFATSEALGFQCMGYDYVIDSRSGQGVIIEMSYAFSSQAIEAAGGYWTRDGVWHEGALDIPAAVIEAVASETSK